ncbi:MAG: hypothetical protein EBT92_18835 [Planctomycetes bacterium]|nr:hypothetical protein [Planctomycetota bacterium]NBY01507.1 hypothetical protein [Planctomycetota bacterium]
MNKVPTDEITHTITSYLQAGGSPAIAAGAAGISEQLFNQWITKGKTSRAPRALKAFYKAVEQAHAQARLRAEIAAFNDKPLEWLKSGPCKGEVDWGKRCPGKKAREEPLPEFQTQKFLQLLLKVLEAYPDARKALADAMHQTKAKV